MPHPSVTSKAKETQQRIDCVASNSAETPGMISYIHLSLPSAVQCKTGMSGLRCKNWNDAFVAPCNSSKTLFPLLMNYNPLAYQSQGGSLRILSQHLALYPARLHKPSSGEHAAKGVTNRPCCILIMEKRTRYSDRWWQAALMVSLMETCLGEWSVSQYSKNNELPSVGSAIFKKPFSFCSTVISQTTPILSNMAQGKKSLAVNAQQSSLSLWITKQTVPSRASLSDLEIPQFDQQGPLLTVQPCAHRQHRFQMHIRIIFVNSQIHPTLSPGCCHPEPPPWDPAPSGHLHLSLYAFGSSVGFPNPVTALSSQPQLQPSPGYLGLPFSPGTIRPFCLWCL